HGLQLCTVRVRNDATDHYRRADPGGTELGKRLRYQCEVGAGQDRQSDDVDVLVARGSRDLGRAEPDALVDDLYAGVARRDRDLLGAVGVAVEAGFADQQPDGASAGCLDDRAYFVADFVHLRPGACGYRAHAGGRAVLAEHRAQRARPFADGAARAGERDRRRHQVLGGGRDAAQLLERGVEGPLVTISAPLLDRAHLFAFDGGIDRHDAAGLRARGQRRRFRL